MTSPQSSSACEASSPPKPPHERGVYGDADVRTAADEASPHSRAAAVAMACVPLLVPLQRTCDAVTCARGVGARA